MPRLAPGHLELYLDFGNKRQINAGSRHLFVCSVHYRVIYVPGE